MVRASAVGASRKDRSKETGRFIVTGFPEIMIGTVYVCLFESVSLRWSNNMCSHAASDKPTTVRN